MSDWRSIVKAVAPTLATALRGPFAGLATKAISQGLLGKDSCTDTDLTTALLDPDSLVKLKSIERDFEVKLKELDVDLERIAVDDRKSARKMATETSTRPQEVLSGVFIAGFFGLLYVVLLSDVELNETLRGAALTLIGVAGTNVTLAMKFWFGGSPNDGKHIENSYHSIPREGLKK